jgi:hypothetical protein
MAIIIPSEEPQSVNPPRLQSQADETTFGGGPGVAAQNEQVQKISQDTNEIATFEKIRADQTAVQGAAAKLDEVHSKLLSDPENGLPAYQGVNAMEGHDKVLAEYQKTANELAKGLQPDQQGAFNKMAWEGGKALNEHAMAYVNKQIEQHDTNTFQAAVGNKAELAANNYGNPDSVALFKNQSDQIAMARAKRLGLDADQTQGLMRIVDSQFHEKVLSQMVNDPNTQGQAKQYFSDHKDEMDVDTREKAAKWISDGSIKSQSNSLAADAMKANPKSESEALDYIDKHATDPDVRAAARSGVSSGFAQNRAAQKNDQEQTFLSVQDQISKAGLTDPYDIKQFIKTTDKDKMSGAQYQALLKSGQDNVTSPKMLIDYHQAIKDNSLASMSRADLQTKFLQYASLSDQKQILKTWSEGQKDQKNLALTKISQDLVDKAAFSAGVIPSMNKAAWKDDKDTVDNWANFNSEAQQRLEAAQQTSGKKLSPDEQKKLIDKLVIDHTFSKPGMLWGTNEVVEPYTKDFSDKVLKDYPNASEEQITKAYQILRKGGKPADARAVLGGK